MDQGGIRLKALCGWQALLEGFSLLSLVVVPRTEGRDYRVTAFHVYDTI